ncbi:MAG TPA: ABC transporter permease [Nocardioidaceae bacterium]|nr:ABC transporter permease [Nocardioidaceae bacterium]
MSSPVIDTTAAELLKLVRRPAAWVLLAVAAVLNLIFAYVVPYLSYTSGSGGGMTDGATPEQLLASTLPDQLVANTIGGFAVFAGALALVLGALMFGSEYGWGTVKTMLTQRAGRGSVLLGQLTALAVAIAVGLLVMFGLGALTSTGIALAEDQAINWPGPLDLAQGYGYGWLILLTWAVLGAALGVLLRGVALPIGLGVVWVLGIENLVTAMATSVLDALEPLRDVLPGVNAGSLINTVLVDRSVEPAPGVTDAVGEGRALLTLACYLVVAGVAAAWSMRRRDIT